MIHPIIFTPQERQHHHQRTIWARFATLILGVWLMTSPWTFGYGGTIARSDLYTGAVLVVLSLLAMSMKLRGFTWVIALVGVWLSFSPLLFWAKSGTAYLNDTLIGALVVAFSIIVPFRPEGQAAAPEIPMGWSYNPSSWYQRAPIIFFGFFGWFIARYLAAYQLGYIDTMWDPFFGDGTVKVITSQLSKSFPVSDAGMGALAYSLEALLGGKGGTRRWYTMPWTVVFFAILVVPLGFISILLVILQPSVVGAWCGLCLFMALAMLVMLALTVDEAVASIQFLHHARKSGAPFWKVFWFGGQPEGILDNRSPGFGCRGQFKSMVLGTNFPWNLILTALIGVWFLCMPGIFHLQGKAADSHFITGALTVVFSLIACSEVIRPVRFVNLLFGIWTIITPWIVPITAMSGSMDHYIWSNVVSGALLILLTIRRGKIKETYGTWTRFIV